jgi:hypothetical protein
MVGRCYPKVTELTAPFLLPVALGFPQQVQLSLRKSPFSGAVQQKSRFSCGVFKLLRKKRRSYRAASNKLLLLFYHKNYLFFISRLISAVVGDIPSNRSRASNCINSDCLRAIR